MRDATPAHSHPSYERVARLPRDESCISSKGIAYLENVMKIVTGLALLLYLQIPFKFDIPTDSFALLLASWHSNVSSFSSRAFKIQGEK